jgi:general secretion pathway protein G
MRRGFTLIELIVVIAIIAVLAAVVAPNAFRAIDKSRVSATVADLNAIKTASFGFFGDCGVWPATTATGAGFVSNAAATAGWDGPYIGSWPAAGKWAGGTYTFTNDNAGGILATGWDSVAGADTARYVIVTGIPAASQARIDIALDGAAGATSGSVRYTAGGALHYLVSIDGQFI